MKELARILVVEDEPAIRTILGMALAGDGYVHVEMCARGDDAVDAARRSRPDLVLLDVMLPGIDGFAVAARLRESPETRSTRILMLTARTQPEDIVRGLDAGADDYVTKPFDRTVLLARIRALLRRSSGGSAMEEFDGLAIDEERMTATLDGAEIKLTPGEFKILALLSESRGRVLPRRRILDAVLPDDRAVTERTVDVQVATLRKKLGRWADRIETVRGVGYRIAWNAGQGAS